jgi:hypothetical protein
MKRPACCAPLGLERERAVPRGDVEHGLSANAMPEVDVCLDFDRFGVARRNFAVAKVD